ncbi:methionine ABC transporter ATP-binding protein [Dongshaea marina]|uniref:methionine ABC transporter ATP-binding protein n=1 Tax=Dongshaea marina TaxID=2047966 RepID=UPI000D3EDC8E|nr:methionine ABC transporter ATP-binding protein [Dongshaea marina]
MIELKNIHKSYQQGNQSVEALRGIDIHIQPGEIFGIIGRSGAGKSTLVRCINLLETPTSGDVILDGVALNQLNAKQLRLERQQIGKVFQHFNLLQSRTVSGNVAFPLELIKQPKEQINNRVNELLELVGLQDKANAYPSELSGGQKQRVAIARALAAEPKVLLCDEATSALDPETTQQILSLLKEINQRLGVTIILVTHEMDVIKSICHRVAVLEAGKVAELTSVLKLFSDPQHPTSKALIQANLHIELPSTLKLQPEWSEQNPDPVVQLLFVGDASEAPVISDLQQHYGVKTSILQADLDTVQDSLFGITILRLIGQPSQIEEALAYCQQQQVKTEVLGYV